MAKYIGMFSFRHEGNGVLTGVYLEHQVDESYPESCKRDTASTDPDPFIGNFKTNYLQPTSSIYDDLIIRKSGNSYDLNWAGNGINSIPYKGKGIIIEGRLVGSYWSIKK